MKSLSINGYEAEVIPSAELIRMLVKLAEKKEIKLTVDEAPVQEGWKLRAAGKTLLALGFLYFAIHLLVWAVK